jgi:hypothetical protein
MFQCQNINMIHKDEPELEKTHRDDRVKVQAGFLCILEVDGPSVSLETFLKHQNKTAEHLSRCPLFSNYQLLITNHASTALAPLPAQTSCLRSAKESLVLYLSPLLLPHH